MVIGDLHVGLPAGAVARFSEHLAVDTRDPHEDACSGRVVLVVANRLDQCVGEGTGSARDLEL